MRSLSRRGWLAIVAVIQLLLVGAAVAGPLSARMTGEEVRLRVSMVDPIDAFRGAYVQLSYPDLPGQAGATGLENRDNADGTAFIPLTRSGDVWVGGTLTSTRPSEGRYLACDDQGWRVRCGIESWFLPEGKAGALAQSLGNGTAVATVKVDARGHAALLGVSSP
jgi:uncharacterized membrane-anchored protein